MAGSSARSPAVLLYAGGFAPVGGIESFLHALSVGLGGREVAVSMVCWGARSAVLRELEANGVPVGRSPWRWGCRWGWPEWLLLPAGLAALGRADVVVFGKLPDARIHRLLMRTRAAKGRLKFLLVTPYRPSEMWAAGGPAEDVLNSFDAIVVQAQSFATDLRQHGYRGSIRVLPYVPPPCRAVVPLPRGELRVGFLGRLVADKNLGHLLRSFALLRGRLESTLHIFGDGPKRAELGELASRLRLGDSVRFHGVVNRPAVAAAVDSCHMFAFSSIREGQCLAALEVLARGRPVVAAPAGVFPELLAEADLGAVAALDNAAGFAEVLGETARRVLEGRLAPERVQAAYAARFPREQILDEYARLFRELAAGKAGVAGG